VVYFFFLFNTFSEYWLCLLVRLKQHVQQHPGTLVCSCICVSCASPYRQWRRTDASIRRASNHFTTRPEDSAFVCSAGKHSL